MLPWPAAGYTSILRPWESGARPFFCFVKRQAAESRFRSLPSFSVMQHFAGQFLIILEQGAVVAAAVAVVMQDLHHLSSLFSLVRRRYEKESFPFVSGRSGKHFIANQLLDSFFQTRAALRVELQEDGVCSAADAENKRQLLSCLWFFDNRGIVHVGQ